MDRELWDKCVEFHGHECPGLAIGYRVSEIAADFFGKMPSAKSDEMVVCITENDACGVDAVQVMTGCTVGKGNLIFRPTGKMAFSFFDRGKNKSIRVILNPTAFGDDRKEKMRWILEAPVEEVFKVGTPEFELPEQARLFASEVCEVCDEAAPEYKMHIQDGKKVCPDCFEDYSRGW
jgi:formylmethanofuran dehydrogenase subunit E